MFLSLTDQLCYLYNTKHTYCSKKWLY